MLAFPFKSSFKWCFDKAILLMGVKFYEIINLLFNAALYLSKIRKYTKDYGSNSEWNKYKTPTQTVVVTKAKQKHT